MSNRIINLNGENAEPKPPNVRDMIEEAWSTYEGATANHKRVAFRKLCDAMHLLSQGIARSFHDSERRDVELKALKERITPK